jgi:hypothetical protein
MPPSSPIDNNGEAGQPHHSECPTTISETSQCQRRTFEDAAQAIADRESPRSGDSAPFGSEVRNLEEWARHQGRLIPENALAHLATVSNSTSEHEVFYRPEDSRAVERTWAGVYGQIPCVADGRLDRRNALP